MSEYDYSMLAAASDVERPRANLGGDVVLFGKELGRPVLYCGCPGCINPEIERVCWLVGRPAMIVCSLAGKARGG